jgi:MFS family permease
VFVALAVYAYDVGGAIAVGAAAIVRMVPAGLAAPFAGVLADRYSRRDVLLGACIARAVILVGIGVAIVTSAPFALVLVLAALFTIAATAHKPAQAALLPSLAQTPRQLAASNAVWSGLDNAAFLLGALVSGGFIATLGMHQVFLLTAALFAAAALPLAGIGRGSRGFPRSPSSRCTQVSGVKLGEWCPQPPLYLNDVPTLSEHAGRDGAHDPAQVQKESQAWRRSRVRDQSPHELPAGELGGLTLLDLGVATHSARCRSL